MLNSKPLLKHIVVLRETLKKGKIDYSSRQQRECLTKLFYLAESCDIKLTEYRIVYGVRFMYD